MKSGMHYIITLVFIFASSFWAAGIAAPENCFHELYSYTGHITSLNYPQPYPSGRNCTWIISTLSIHRLQLTFSEFDLEYQKSCKYDHVTVYDGASTEDKVLGKSCGQSIPQPMISSKNVIRINFYTDSRVERSGFNLTYDSAMCGHNFLQREGSFDSPHFPNNYPGYKRCIWTIETSDDLQVSLNLNSIQLSNSSICAMDYMSVFTLDSINNEWRGTPFLSQASIIPLAFLCKKNETSELKHTLSDLRSSSNKMFLMYVSESPIQGLRFKAFFTSVPCGGVYERDEGILSVVYPENHMKNADCVWIIRVSEGYQVFLHSTALQVLDTPNCTTDYLEIRDGLNDTSPLLGNRTCGTNVAKSVRSTSNTMLIRFKSNASSNARGFVANFAADVDECENGADMCAHNCVNTIGGYNCTCNDGYEVLSNDNRKCSDKNECATGEHSCQQTCINTEGGYECSCSIGYTLNEDKHTCSDVNECLTELCPYGCENTIGSFICKCRNGYVIRSDGTCRSRW